MMSVEQWLKYFTSTILLNEVKLKLFIRLLSRATSDVIHSGNLLRSFRLSQKQECVQNSEVKLVSLLPGPLRSVSSGNIERHSHQMLPAHRIVLSWYHLFR
jgi:hypothetical protein